MSCLVFIDGCNRVRTSLAASSYQRVLGASDRLSLGAIGRGGGKKAIDMVK